VGQAGADNVALTAVQDFPERLGGSRIRLGYELDSRVVIALKNLHCTVGRGAVLHYELDVAVGLAEHTFDAALDRHGAILAATDDRHQRLILYSRHSICHRGCRDLASYGI